MRRRRRRRRALRQASVRNAPLARFSRPARWSTPPGPRPRPISLPRRRISSSRSAGLLEQPAQPGAAGTPRVSSDGQADADLNRALDAYDAAAQTLDGAAGIPDLAGVLVLTHLGRCAARAARARQSGQPVPPASWLCFFNPLHGAGEQRVRWRARGGQQALDVHACGACADDIAQRRFPSVLTGKSGSQDVPYYETGSIWAATGYGQFSGDLAQRVLAMAPDPGRR